MSDTPYDPTLRGLIAQTDEDWLDPELVQANMVHFGINYIDQALYGMNFLSGELIGIQAEAKRRKSTMLANVVLNVAYIFSQRNPMHWICIDTLESGMPPKAYRDMLISMTATRILIAEVFGTNRTNWPAWSDINRHPDLQRELGLSKEFLWFCRRSQKQHAAIERAKIMLSRMPITIFGPVPGEGETRNLNKGIARWHALYNGEFKEAEGCEHRLFCSDHVQQYKGWAEDYGKLEAVNNAHSQFVAEHANTVAVEVSQLSVTSMRLERQGMGQAQAKGGAKLEAEVNILFRTRYDKVAAPWRMLISVEETRRRPPPDVYQELDPDSGAFLRPAYPVNQEAAGNG